MNNKLIKILLVLLVALLAGIIVWDFTSKRPGKGKANPWEYNVDEFKSFEDSALLKYNEVLNIKLAGSDSLKGMAYSDGRIYIIGMDFLQVISPEGREFFRKVLPESPKCITVNGDKVFIAYSSQIETYNLKAELISSWKINGEDAAITSIAVYNDLLFAADASNRCVLRYNTKGEFLGEFDGKSEKDQLHGFIIPSGCFDLAISDDGELWVVNPGKHSLELYSHDGKLIRYWENASFSPEGFSGCCNPVHIAILPDGSFVTSEKGIFRVKVHKSFGDIYGFVASPDLFEDAEVAPDISVSADGLIYVLDFKKKVVRVFKHK